MISVLSGARDSGEFANFSRGDQFSPSKVICVQPIVGNHADIYDCILLEVQLNGNLPVFLIPLNQDQTR
jgi:hypothetical protein